jgi:hypothetical protein
MAFSAVFQWLPGDEGGLNRFLLEHYVEHQQFYKALLSLGVRTTNLPIQRIENWPDWLAAHQQVSQSVWTGLGGGQSTDFGTVRYDEPTAMQDWMQFHSLWHKAVRDSLGL